MKLVQIALVATFAVGLAVPAMAAEMTQAQMDMMKGEMSAAGKTDAERVAYWKTMKPERQTAWKGMCNSLESLSLPENEKNSRGDIDSFCKSWSGAF